LLGRAQRVTLLSCHMRKLVSLLVVCIAIALAGCASKKADDSVKLSCTRSSVTTGCLCSAFLNGEADTAVDCDPSSFPHTICCAEEAWPSGQPSTLCRCESTESGSTPQSCSDSAFKGELPKRLSACTLDATGSSSSTSSGSGTGGGLVSSVTGTYTT